MSCELSWRERAEGEGLVCISMEASDVVEGCSSAGELAVGRLGLDLGLILGVPGSM